MKLTQWTQNTLNQAMKLQIKLENVMKIDSKYTRTLIASAPVKSCELDPIPTTPLWNLDSAVPIITKIINLSLKHGEMPNVVKESSTQTFTEEV